MLTSICSSPFRQVGGYTLWYSACVCVTAFVRAWVSKAYIMAYMFSQSGCSDQHFNAAVNQTAGGLTPLRLRAPPACSTGNISHVCQELFTPAASSLLPSNYSLWSLSPLVSAVHQSHTQTPVPAAERTLLNGCGSGVRHWLFKIYLTGYVRQHVNQMILIFYAFWLSVA